MSKRKNDSENTRHDMSRANRGRVSTLKKAQRMARIDAGLRPDRVVIDNYHPTKGWRFD